MKIDGTVLAEDSAMLEIEFMEQQYGPGCQGSVREYIGHLKKLLENVPLPAELVDQQQAMGEEIAALKKSQDQLKSLLSEASMIIKRNRQLLTNKGVDWLAKVDATLIEEEPRVFQDQADEALDAIAARKKTYAKGATARQILMDGWSRGFDEEQTQSELKEAGHGHFSTMFIRNAWSHLDVEANAFSAQMVESADSDAPNFDKLVQILNEARCNSKRIIGNRELARRIVDSGWEFNALKAKENKWG